MKHQSEKCVFFFRMFILATLFLLFHSGVSADTLDDILKRKKIVVGVSKDQGFLSKLDTVTGSIKGFEPDLARDLAKRLNVELELVPLSLSQRKSAVTERKVDVLIATLTDSKEHRTIMVPVVPHYYRSGVSLLSRKENNIQYWDDLQNQRVCANQGAYFNRYVMVRFGVDIIPLYSRELALDALLDGRCVGLLYLDSPENATLETMHRDQNFKVSLDKLTTPPWSVYLSLKDKDSKLEKWISETVSLWHKDGLIIALELILNSAFALSLIV